MKDSGKARYVGLTPEEVLVGLEVAQVGIGSVDYRADTLRLDETSAEIFDLPAGMPIPRETLHGRIHPEDWPDVERHVEALLSTTGDDVIDLTHRIIHEDGTIRWVHARKKVRFDDIDGAPRAVSGVFALVDVTAEKQSEIQSRMLIGELNHRTKNLLTVVLSIARQLGRHSSAESFQDRFMDRIAALSRNQDALAHGALGANKLSSLLERQLAPFQGQNEGRVRIDGPAVVLSQSAAMVVSMMVHELATNAVKHGALSNSAGRVDIRWTLSDASDPVISFDWSEHGGPEVVPPTRSGFGTQVLTVFVEGSFGARVTLDYAPEGFRAHLAAPLARLQEDH